MLTSLEERIREIEEEIRKTPYNKATQHHIGRLKARLARLRESARRPGGGVAVRGIRKSGDATVALVGFPSVGKSTLLNRITEASSKVGGYDFTTLRAVPGVVSHQGARIQVLDLPGLTEGASHGRGRGREVLSQARMADLLLLMIDIFRRDLDKLLHELREGGIRVNQEPPRMVLRKRDRGGLEVRFTVPQTVLDEEVVKGILREWGIVNAEVVIREDTTEDRLIDFLAGSRVYVPGIVAVNKVDLISQQEVEDIIHRLEGWSVIPISAQEGIGLDRLLEAVYSSLSLMRVYLRPPGSSNGRGEPLVVKQGARVKDVCRALHGDLLTHFRFARVWGASARFPGQKAGLDHPLEDGDTITIFT